MGPVHPDANHVAIKQQSDDIIASPLIYLKNLGAGIVSLGNGGGLGGRDSEFRQEVKIGLDDSGGQLSQDQRTVGLILGNSRLDDKQGRQRNRHKLQTSEH